MRKMLRLERDTISIAFLRALEPVFGTSTKMYLYSISIYLTSKIIIWNKSKLLVNIISRSTVSQAKE